MLNCSGIVTLCCNLHTGNGAVRCEGICGILWLWGKCNWRFKGLLTDSCTSAVVNHPKGSFGISVSVAALGCGCRKEDFYLHLSAFQLYFLQKWAMLLFVYLFHLIFFEQNSEKGWKCPPLPEAKQGRRGQTSICRFCPTWELSELLFLGKWCREGGFEPLWCREVRWEGANPQGINLEFCSSCNNCFCWGLASQAHNSRSEQN